VNFYKRHLGDIAKACGHLSQGQQGAYDLLLDWLYGNERPLPQSKDALYRIGRAVTKAERDNVDFVIEDFFTLTPEGYTQKRASEEIAKANAQAETNRRIAEEREARKRGNKHAPFDEPSHDSSNGSCTNRQPSQTPDSRHQQKATGRAPEISQGEPSPAGLACRLMRDAGCTGTNPSHPDLLAALAAGVTPETLAATVHEALEAGIRKPFAWAIATARGRHLDGPRAAESRAAGLSLADAAAAEMAASPAPVVAGVIPFRGALVHER